MAKKKKKKHSLRKTTILVRGYCANFEVEVRKDHFYTIEEATDYVQEGIISTAMIKGVIHHTSEGEKHIKNENYTDPTEIILNDIPLNKKTL